MIEAIHQEWNIHDHRDELRVSCFNTVYHPNRGQLCYGIKHLGCWLFMPFQFKSREVAAAWIAKGTVAELQEGLSILSVGITNDCHKEI